MLLVVFGNLAYQISKVSNKIGGFLTSNTCTRTIVLENTVVEVFLCKIIAESQLSFGGKLKFYAFLHNFNLAGFKS